MFRHVFTALLLAGSVSAAAAEPAKPAPKAQPDPNEVVCTYEVRTGSHLKRKICTTRAVREREAKDSREALESIRRSGGGGSGSREGGL